MGMFPIPQKFLPWFGKIPSKITLLTNTGYKCDMAIKFDSEKAIIDQGGHHLSFPIILGLATSSPSTRNLLAST
jgi:hypothetical protein